MATAQDGYEDNETRVGLETASIHEVYLVYAVFIVDKTPVLSQLSIERNMR